MLHLGPNFPGLNGAMEASSPWQQPSEGRGMHPPTEHDALQARLDALNSRRHPAAPPTGPPAALPPNRTGTRSGRRHAAKGARAAALGLSLASTGALGALFALTNGQPAAANQIEAASIVAGAPASTPPVPATAAPTPKTQPPPVLATSTVVDGGVFNNKWGDVQVEATFGADGTLLDVSALQTPDRDSKSVRINDGAVPQLNSEALTAQSAQVDTVSGATYTSDDYRRSLQSAIDVAKSAGLTAII